jgi:hypothetical protein
MSKHTPEITEADRKAIGEYVRTIAQEGFEYDIGNLCAEWGIKHARAEVNAQSFEAAKHYANQVTQQAERIAELEASVELYKRHFLNEEKTSEERYHRIEELEAEVAMYKEDARILKAQRIHDMKVIAALQSPSSAKDTPDNYTKLMEARSKLMYISANSGNEDVQRYANHAWQIITDISFIAAGLKSSPVSVDINQELVEALEEIIHMQIDENRLYWTIDDMRLKAAAALSKASPPKQNEK